MIDQVATHYSAGGGLADTIAKRLRSAGKNLDELKTADLATVDEFHIRGRKATLELAEKMKGLTHLLHQRGKERLQNGVGVILFRRRQKGRVTRNVSDDHIAVVCRHCARPPPSF